MPVRCAHPDCQRWPFQHGLCKAHKGYTPGQEGNALAPVDTGAKASAATKAPASAPPSTGKPDESRSNAKLGEVGVMTHHGNDPYVPGLLTLRLTATVQMCMCVCMCVCVWCQ